MPAGRRKPGSAESQHCSSNGQRGRSGERDHAVVPDHDSGGGETVDREQSRHHREGRSDEDHASVAAADADHRQRKRSNRGQDRTDPDSDEVDARAEVVRVVPEVVERRHGKDASDPEQGKIGDHAIARDWPH
jgi:hypothetical protein